MDATQASKNRSWWIRLGPYALVAAVALAMGVPSTGGTFVGGDDHRLALDHIYVNHPSLEHTVKLFFMRHRDLYQPIPLATFAGEFALAEKLGWFDEGPDQAARLFHATNVGLHTINAMLVLAVVGMLHRPRAASKEEPAPPGLGVGLLRWRHWPRLYSPCIRSRSRWWPGSTGG